MSSEAALSQYVYGGVLGFRDGSLIQNISDGKMYLISGSLRRHITNPDVFERLGMDEKGIIRVSDKEVKLHKEGESLE